jgi:histone deacetylase HOS3
LDKLAGDMKKIKITVVSKAQREAREKERLERERQAQAKLVVQPSSSTAATVPVDVEPANSVVQTPTIAVSPPLLSTENGVSGGHTEFEPATVPPQQAAFPESTPVPQTLPTTSLSSANDVLTSFQSGFARVPTVMQQQPIQPQASSTSTPTVMNQINLPVFTSTSAIPFAPRPSSHENTVPDTAQQESPINDMMWEIPETPRH